MTLSDIVDLTRYPLEDAALRTACRDALAREGALVMRGFLTPAAISTVLREGEQNRHRAYFCAHEHNVYLTPPDPAFAPCP